jgi:hypothetical protein
MTGINPVADRLIALLAARDVAVEMLDEADWERLNALAQRHGVAPMLYATLKKRAITPPPAIADQLRQIYLASASRNLHLFQELGKILRALQSANIAVIPLKGACLAQAIYGNIALRPMGDVDLLVKPDEMARALDVLRALGYASVHSFDPVIEQTISQHMPPMYKAGGLHVEMHWTIVSPRSNIHLNQGDLDQLWSRAVTAQIAGVQVLTLGSEDLLVHLCLHASIQHRFDGAGLRNYFDIALVILQYGDTIDWTQFALRANQWGCANGVHLALQLTEEWTGVAVPSAALAALQAVPLDEATIDWVREKILNGSSLALQSDVARFEGKARIADKVDALRAVLFPTRVQMARMYAAPAESWRILLYYPMRFKELWMRYSQSMWQLLWRDKKLTADARREARLREYLGWN